MLRLTPAQSDQLRAHAERAYPEECCGILLGTAPDAGSRLIVEIVACKNAHPSPRTGYAIQPQDLITAQKRARAAGLAIVGFYHSHPDAPPEPSRTDRAEASWSDSSYVIVAVTAGHATELRSFRMRRDSGLEPERLEL